MSTRDGWNVSVTTEVGHPEKGARLSVFRSPFGLPSQADGKPWPVYGDAEGLMFPDDDAAFAYAEKAGYTEPFYRSVQGRRCRYGRKVRADTGCSTLESWQAAERVYPRD